MTNKQITFQGGLKLLAVFLLLLTVDVVIGRVISDLWQFGPEVSVVGINVSSFILSSIMVGITWLILRIEGVRLTEIGLSPTLIGPAIVAVGGFLAVLNIVGIGLALGTGNPESVGYHWELSPILLLEWLAVMIVFAGFFEEFLVRGYLQTKLIALLGGDTRVRIAAGIAVASLLFAALHIPRAVTPNGVSIEGGGLLPYMAIIVVSGIAFGVLYELTHNLYIPVFIHSVGNLPGGLVPVFAVFEGWPGWALGTFQIAYILSLVLMIWLYRRWAFDTGRMPVWTSRDDVAFRI